MKEFIETLITDPQVAEAILAEHQKVVSGYEERMQSALRESALKQAVTAAGGRNLTAIRALIADDSLAGDDPDAAARMAVAAVKRENPYLFAGAVTAPGTGGAAPMGYTQQELAKLPMSEYRRYRKGL